MPTEASLHTEAWNNYGRHELARLQDMLAIQKFLIPVSKTLDMDQKFLILAYKPSDISKVLQIRIRNFLSVSEASQYRQGSDSCL